MIMNRLKIALCCAVVFTACTPIVDDGQFTPPLLSMDMPDSLTGGNGSVNQSPNLALVSNAAQQGVPCVFLGSDSADPFVNGYETSRFLVSQMATWTCIADLVISAIDFTINDGEIHATDNNKTAENYNPEDPTHYQVLRSTDTTTSVRMFYGFERTTPPTKVDSAGIVLQWTNNEDDLVEGALSLDVNYMDKTPNLEDPTGMRLNFSQSNTVATNDMFLIFDDSHEDVEAMRVKITEDKNAIHKQEAFTVQALVKVKKQWLTVESVTTVPDIKLVAITDKLGDGASRLLISDLAVALPIAENNHLGDYLFDKTDNYYFSANISDANWDWIEKSVTQSSYEGIRTTPISGGTWIPFNPSLDQLINAFELDATYFTNGQCEAIGDSCNELMNAIFQDGFAGQEPNQGQDPQDWRTDAMQSAEYLNSVYPNGTNWDDALIH